MFSFVLSEEKLVKYDKEQTRCMGREGNSWNDQLCDTKVENNLMKEIEIRCSCNMMRAESVAVFNDESRIKAGSIPIVKDAIKLIEKRKSMLRRTSSLKFAVALAILGLIVISSIIYHSISYITII